MRFAPRTWFGPQVDPAAIAKCQGTPNPTNHRQWPFPGWDRLGASPGSRVHARRANPWLAKTAISAALGCGAVAAARARVEEVQGFSGAEMEQSQRRRVGREAEGRSQGVAVNNRERYESSAMVMVAGVAQQDVAAEAAPRVSHADVQCRSRPR
jgi:hypothetical protein